MMDSREFDGIVIALLIECIMRRQAVLGTSDVAITSLTGCIGRFQNGYILNRLVLSEISGRDQETDQEEIADNVEIIVECDGEEVHTSTHARPIEQPSEREPVVVPMNFPMSGVR